MTTFHSFVDIDAWQKARELTYNVYAVTRQPSFSKDFGLRDQIRRSSVSVMANIAEGFGRSGSGEFVQFLAVAKGSACEVISHLYALAGQTINLIGGLMKYLQQSALKGSKFKR